MLKLTKSTKIAKRSVTRIAQANVLSLPPSGLMALVTNILNNAPFLHLRLVKCCKQALLVFGESQ